MCRVLQPCTGAWGCRNAMARSGHAVRGGGWAREGEDPNNIHHVAPRSAKFNLTGMFKNLLSMAARF